MNQDDLRELIIDLRGGLPPFCDFCRKPTLPENLHPEEGGDWACIECIERWRKEHGENETRIF